MLGSFTNTLSSVVFVNDKCSSCKNQFEDINTGERLYYQFSFGVSESIKLQ